MNDTYWLKSSTKKCGCSFSRLSRVWEVHVARTKQPAAFPERIPVGASSTTIPVIWFNISEFGRGVKHRTIGRRDLVELSTEQVRIRGWLSLFHALGGDEVIGDPETSCRKRLGGVERRCYQYINIRTRSSKNRRKPTRRANTPSLILVRSPTLDAVQKLLHPGESDNTTARFRCIGEDSFFESHNFGFEFFLIGDLAPFSKCVDGAVPVGGPKDVVEVEEVVAC